MYEINNSTAPFKLTKEQKEEIKSIPEEIKSILNGDMPTPNPTSIERSHNEAVGTGMYLLLLLNQMISSYIDTADGYAKVSIGLIQKAEQILEYKD